jgi:zinc D-Ala-D-Ala dipeptidase
MTNSLATRRIIEYQEFLAVPVHENGEPLVNVRTYDSQISARYIKPDMKPYLGETIVVRRSLAQKLAAANARLMKAHNLRLRVAYGYRHPEVQAAYFTKRKAELRLQNPNLPEDELMALTHNFVAVPGVAGHPVGGAVDLTIIDQQTHMLDMGTAIADYHDPAKIKTFAADVTPEQKKNRLMLHDVMVEQGFAPFYGEWWHFAYGDREWAAFYGQPATLYAAINLPSA